MIKHIKLWSVLLCIAMLAGVFAACDASNIPADTSAQTETATQASTQAVTQAVTEEVTEAMTEAATEAKTEIATEAVTEAATEMTTEAVTLTETQAPTAPVYTVVGNAHTSMVSRADQGTPALSTIYDQAGYETWDGVVIFDRNGDAVYLCELGFVAFNGTVESIVFGYELNGAMVWDDKIGRAHV